MGFKFRKSVKIAPGVRMNIGKKGASVSVGTKGARMTIGSGGKVTSTVGIPGTGLSYSTTSGKKKKEAKIGDTAPTTIQGNKTVGIILQVISAFILLISVPFAFALPFSWVFIIFGGFMFWLGNTYRKAAKKKED